MRHSIDINQQTTKRLLEGLPKLGIDAVVDTMNYLKVLGEAVGLLLLGNDGDTLQALVVLLKLMGAVVVEALLLEVKLNILGIVAHDLDS